MNGRSSTGRSFVAVGLTAAEAARLKPCPPTFVQIPFKAGCPIFRACCENWAPRKTSPEALLAAVAAGGEHSLRGRPHGFRCAADRKQVPRLRRSFAWRRIFFARNDRNLGNVGMTSACITAGRYQRRWRPSSTVRALPTGSLRCRQKAGSSTAKILRFAKDLLRSE
jgi:hypothetical protein